MNCEDEMIMIYFLEHTVDLFQLKDSSINYPYKKDVKMQCTFSMLFSNHSYIFFIYYSERNNSAYISSIWGLRGRYVL